MSKNRAPTLLNKSALLLLWMVGFTCFNYWMLRIPSYDGVNTVSRAVADRRVEGVRGGRIEDASDEYDDALTNPLDYDDEQNGHEEETLPLPFVDEEESDNQLPEFSLGDLRGEKKGKIAWLMSFPNSGTSFTSLLIRHASNATTASNYGLECNPGEDGKSVPVHDWSLEGPFWLHPPSNDNYNSDQIMSESGMETGKSGNYPIPVEGASILTKTHCGGRCNFCPPKRYLETWQSFLTMCLSGARSVPATPKPRKFSAKYQKYSQEYKKESVTYHPSLVERAVHLIRNPFDNLVSRFHHEQKEHKKRNEKEWIRRYSNDARGFRKWCADEDILFRTQEQTIDWEALGYDANEMKMHFEGVACHAEFFRYVQWHNLAVESVKRLDIPVLYVHYEDYASDLKGSTDRMLKFLNMRRAGKLPEFDSDKDYSEYFTLEERAAASELMRVLAGDDARELMEGYWVGLDFRAMRKQIQAILD